MARETTGGRPTETHIDISSTPPGIGTIPIEESAFWNAQAERGRHIAAAMVSLTPDVTGVPPLVQAANYWGMDDNTLYWASQSLQSLVAGRETPAIAAFREQQAQQAVLISERKRPWIERLAIKVTGFLGDTLGNPFGFRDLDQSDASKERQWE